ncbi:MAG: MiaB/RimO family radical SAM methylthiotransferase [Synergistaceae bacterium]|nr:MiaB/RimO family radical SAM methylthiotransferase [Synergistaceae bacterium]
MQSGQSMGLIYIHVFGCRSSLCEGEFIAGALKSMGYDITEDLSENINAAVIVSCSVTGEADKKCRQLVRRVRKTLAPDKILAVCGCWSQSLGKSEALSLGINLLAGSKSKNILPDIIASKIALKDSSFQDLRTQNIFEPSQWEELAINSPVMHSRAFMKIQDGCDHFCTYCIIPFLRGRPVSRPIDSILDEIRRLIDNGTKEIIFTGIHLGIYGRDINFSLAQLINEAAKIPGLERIRLGSLEPFSLDNNLLDSLADCESFCHHLHLPLQSGDDEILSLMRRGYTSGDFIKICGNARKKLGENLHISSDILIGFPGESEQAFNHTLNIMRESRLGRVHVFPYSIRKGTQAAIMQNQISHETKIFRVSQAIKLGRELYNNYVKNFIGQDVKILIERENFGHTENYIEAVCEGENLNRGEIITAKAVSESDGILKAVI